MGLENPVGETIKAYGRNYTVIGVVEDMISQSLFSPVQQTFFVIDPFNQSELINVKINTQVSTSQAMAAIEKAFKKHNPATLFEYRFIDEQLADKFYYEARVGKLAGFFAILAVLISCLGLFGLASYMAEQRTKEIGIRKVLGASVFNVWQLLSKDFIWLVIVSVVIATPLAYYFMYDWLQKYEYRTPISWWIFALAGLSALVLTLLTVSYQTIKAALMNPIRSLRNE
jgi:ABC-type antimicrobial peptide transport system permease subunit